MIITEVVFPKIIDYYVSENCKKKIRNTLINASAELLNDKIIVTTGNDFEVLDALRLIRSKTEKVTLGNERVFEYELDISMSQGHLFSLTLDDQSTVDCTLIIVNNLQNNDLNLVFSF